MKERKTKRITELAVKILHSMVTSNQKHTCKNLTQNSKQTSAFLTLNRFPKPRPELSENSMQHYYIKSASAFSVGSQHDATRICCRAPVSAAQRPHVSIDISCPQGAQQKKPAARRCCCRSRGQTDRRRTPDRYTDPVSHTMRAASRNRTVIV